MSNSLNDLIKYFCTVYPYGEELSKARLTKMVYLADWENFKINNHQLTDIYWYFDNFGPYVTDVVDVAYNDPYIKLISTRTIYGTDKTLIQYKGELPTIDVNVKKILDKVIEDTKSLSWKNFIDYVYSTTPIKNSEHYSFLNFSKYT